MKLGTLVVLLLVACGDKKDAPPRNELEAFERERVVEAKLLAKGMRARGREVADKEIPTQYRAIFIGPSGVFIDRKLVARLDELESKHDELVAAIDANLKVQPSYGFTPTMVFDIDDKPAKVAVDALRLFAWHQVLFTRRRHAGAEMPSTTETLCDTKVRIGRETEEEIVVLSVLISTTQTWVGLSRVNEFQSIPALGSNEPDWEKLEATLKEHKQSTFFEDRRDIEIGAEAGTSLDVLHLFDIACKVGFTDVAVLPAAELSAVPKL